MERGIYLLISTFIIGIIPSYGQLSEEFFRELLVALAPRPTPTAEIAAALSEADKCYREGFIGTAYDIYMQYNVLGQNIRLIGGYRWDMGPTDENNLYGGLGLSTPSVLGFNAYASYIAGKDFNETQVGLNKSLIANLDLNVNYHNFKPDHGSRENGIGVGLTMHF